MLEVTDDDDLLIATQRGQVVRTPVRDISTLGRATQGVRLVRFKEENDQVASVGRMLHEDEAPVEPPPADPGAPPVA